LTLTETKRGPDPLSTYQIKFKVKKGRTWLGYEEVARCKEQVEVMSRKERRWNTDEWIKKMWYLYTMEFYAAMKKNEMLSFAGKWMELENIILSDVSLAQKTKNRMFSLICGH
jgi:hypothetical protein